MAKLTKVDTIRAREAYLDINTRIRKNMGKPSTGAFTIYESFRLNIKDIKERYIRDGCISEGAYTWSRNGEVCATINIQGYYVSGKDCFIDLSYCTTDRHGNKVNHSYRINLVEVESNLGKGKVLYFICPETARRCRILYIAYGSTRFKCRQAYLNHGQRLYYDCQIASQVSRYNDSWWRIESHIEKLGKFRKEYAGKETKTYARIQRLWDKQIIMD